MPDIGVETPDGGIAYFPEGTHPDTMRDVLRAKFGGGPAKGVAADMSGRNYTKMGPVELGKTAISNVPASAARFGHDIVQPVIHPIETATNIGRIGKGVLQKLGIMEGKEAEPYADAVGKFLVDRFGSGAAITKTLAEDPVGLFADIATVLSGGGGLAARAPGVAGKLGGVASAVGRTVDPLSVAGGAAKLSGGLAAKGLGMTTGAGTEAITTAARAGAEGGEAGAAFRGGMTGAVTGEEAVKEARGAVEQLRQQRGDAYRKSMTKIGADDTVLDFGKVDSAVDKVAGVKSYKGQNISPGTASIREKVTGAVQEWKSLDPKEYHTAEGLDALKQKIGDIRDATQYGTPERVVADSVYHAIRNTIVEQAPEYGKTMKGYEEASRQIKEIEKTLSLPGGNKVNIDTALRKLQSTLRNNVNTNYGRRRELADFLVSSGAPHLMEKLAGMSLSSATPRGFGQLLGGGEVLASLASLIAGNPVLAAKLAALTAASSPKLVGGAAYAAGAATRAPLRGLGQSAFQTGRFSEVPP